MNKLDILKNKRKKLLALVLVGNIALNLSACVKKNETKDETSLIITNDVTDETTRYEYVIDSNFLDFGEINPKTVEIASIKEVNTYTSIISPYQVPVHFFKDKNLFVIPSSLMHYYGINGPDFFDEFFYNNHVWEFNAKFTVMTEINGSTYTLAESCMEATNPPKLSDKPLNKDDEIIELGSTIKSKAIIINEEIVAFEQTGFGSQSQNVIEAKKGNINLALIPIKDIIGNESINISYSELKNYMNTNHKKHN